MSIDSLLEKLPTLAWNNLGGVASFYPLQLEHARKRLFDNTEPVEHLFQVHKIESGPGVFQAVVHDREEREFKLWLFPDGNGSYIDDSVILNSFPGTDVWMKVLCWTSKLDTTSLFVFKIIGPALLPQN